jgi:hypothetical protein
MEQRRGGCVFRATLLADELDYDGTRVLRGLRNGFALAGLAWIIIALTVQAFINPALTSPSHNKHQIALNASPRPETKSSERSGTAAAFPIRCSSHRGDNQCGRSAVLGPRKRAQRTQGSFLHQGGQSD